MANRDRDRDQYQTSGGDYTGQSQMISDDFLSQGTNQCQRSDVDRSYDSSQNLGLQGSNQYQNDTDKLSDSVGSGGYMNQGSRGDTEDRSFGSSPRYGFENQGSGFNRMGDDLYSDSTRGSSDNRGGLNQYQSSTDRMSDLTPNSGGSYDKATNFLQQARQSYAGEQVKSMAQGAADAVKNTLGMNSTGEANTRYGSSTYSSEDSSYPSNNPSNRV